jgi:hypothetical protein
MHLFVKPQPGMIVRDPRTKLPLPESGKEVPSNSYWIRRLKGGDVVLGNKKKAQKAQKESKPVSTEADKD